jgi:Protein of unknown function (DUF2793)
MSDLLPFASTTPRFALPLLFAGQAQKEVFVNEALLRADLLLHCVIEGEVETPPPAPAPGQAWLIGTAPAGAFAGQARSIAGWTEAGWRFVAPRDGLRVFDRSSASFQVFSSNTWHKPGGVAEPSGGTVIDTQARQALSRLLEQLRLAGILTDS